MLAANPIAIVGEVPPCCIHVALSGHDEALAQALEGEISSDRSSFGWCDVETPLPDDRGAVPTGSNAERSMPDARWTIDGGAEG
jgi:hypothetical protein